MKLIETLSEKISEEICDAKSYAELAIENRESYPDLAQTLYELSVEEMGHMSRLHTAVAGIIEQYRKELVILLVECISVDTEFQGRRTVK